MIGYTLEDEDGDKFSSDPDDYFWAPPDYRFDGLALVKEQHPYRTVTGLTVWAPRLLKRDPTVADLRRIVR